jgi:hypothetical protein
MGDCRLAAAGQADCASASCAGSAQAPVPLQFSDPGVKIAAPGGAFGDRLLRPDSTKRVREMRTWALLSLCLASFACGGGGTSTPAAPTPTQQNRNPIINSMTVTPTFGIANIATFSYAVSASDPDGDSLTYAWDLAGNPASASNGQIQFTNGFDGSFRVTVTDAHGATATDTRSITVGSMTGTWSGAGQSLGDFTMKLTQTATFVTGTYHDSFGDGKIDAAQPGHIDANGNVEMRVKQGQFTDWTFHGQMDRTGHQVTGNITGSGFTGQAFAMTK